MEAGLITRRMLDGAQWRRLLHDVYLHDSLPVDHAARCEAAALVMPNGAAISGRSALTIWCRAFDLPPDEPAEVTVPPEVSMRRQPMLRIRRSGLPQADVFRFGDLPVTTPTRTAVDLGRGPDLTAAVIALDLLLTRRVVTKAEIAEYAEASRLHGIGRLSRALRLAEIGAESPMETRTRLVIVLAGLPQPVPQVKAFDEAGRFLGRLDLAFPDAKVGIEYDGDHHRDRFVFQQDAFRLNRLRLAGWTILRFTAGDVLRYPERIVEQTRAALSKR